MEITKLSCKGQVVIPKTFRQSHHWMPGLELIVSEMGDGLLLKPKATFAETSLNEVAGCLKYTGNSKTQSEIDTAIEHAIQKVWRDSN